jgi:hypothetical protein
VCGLPWLKYVTHDFRVSIRWRSFNGIRKSRHSRRRVPPKRSHTAFAWGARTGVRTPKAITSLSSPRKEDAIPVVDPEAIWMIVWQRLPEPLQGPLRSWVVGHVLVEDPRLGLG